MLSFKDSKLEIKNYIYNNKLINDLLGNILFITFLIVCVIILIIYKLSFNNNIIKIFIYSLISTLAILVVHNHVVKLNYMKFNKSKIDNEFSEMMDQNTKNIINNPIRNTYDGQGESNDIINFLN